MGALGGLFLIGGLGAMGLGLVGIGLDLWFWQLGDIIYNVILLVAGMIAGTIGVSILE